MRATVTALAVAAFFTLTSGSSTATHVGSALWLNGVAPTDTAADSRPDVATDGAGTWIAVWDSAGGAYGSDFDILFSRSTDGGHTWSVTAPLNADAATDAGSDLLAQLEWDGSGTWLVVWAAEGHAATGADRDIYSARSTDGGLSWSAPVPVDTNAATDTGDDSNPQAAGDGAGKWVTVWDSTDTLGGTIGIDPDILVSRSSDGGASWSPPTALNSDAATDEWRDQSPEVQTDGAGNWVAAWETLNQLGPGEGPDNDLLVSRSTNNGATWTALAPLHADLLTDTGQDHLIQIETDSAGTWVGVWNSKRAEPVGPNRDILAVRSFDAGATWTVPADVRTDAGTDTLEEYAPQLTADGYGNWVVVWSGQDPVNDPGLLDYDAYVALSTEDALSWKPAAYLSANGTSDSGGDAHSQVATDGRGSWVMAWDSSETLGGQIGPDREILYVNCLPFDLDGDGLSPCSDGDDDGDLAGDLAEGSCGSDSMEAGSRPERLDGVFLGADDDGDGLTDEPLATASDGFDCDGDGYIGAAEAHVFEVAIADQDPCGIGGWPPDFVGGGIPQSTNRVNILDITSFLAPVRRLGTSPGDGGFSVRWDLTPGPGLFTEVINIQDLTSLISVRPPMLGYSLANNGPVCPWSP